MPRPETHRIMLFIVSAPEFDGSATAGLALGETRNVLALSASASRGRHGDRNGAVGANAGDAAVQVAASGAGGPRALKCK
jgi:hypothetical protein